MGGHHGGDRRPQSQTWSDPCQHRPVDAAARRLCRQQDQIHADPAREGFRVSWKTDLKLTDLEDGTAVEILCKRCGLSHYETQMRLMQRPEFTPTYLDYSDPSGSRTQPALLEPPLPGHGSHLAYPWR